MRSRIVNETELKVEYRRTLLPSAARVAATVLAATAVPPPSAGPDGLPRTIVNRRDKIGRNALVRMPGLDRPIKFKRTSVSRLPIPFEVF